MHRPCTAHASSPCSGRGPTHQVAPVPPRAMDGGGPLGDPVMGLYGATAGRSTVTLDCPRNMVGRAIGKNGTTIKSLQSYTGSLIQVNQVRCAGMHWVVDAHIVCPLSHIGSDTHTRTRTHARTHTRTHTQHTRRARHRRGYRRLR
jgi:hypothetical protein